MEVAHLEVCLEAHRRRIAMPRNTIIRKRS